MPEATSSPETCAELRLARDAARDELQDFLYAVAHDLRAPLRHIRAYAQVLREDCPDLPAAAAQPLAVIERAAQTLSAQIEGLTHLSRLGTRQLILQPVDLSASLRQAVQAAQTHPSPWQAEWVWALDDAALVQADAVLLAEVWAALLDNARKAVRNVTAPRLRVEVQHQADTWRVVLADNGLGFDPEQAAGLFKPFAKLHAARDFEGLGLGLVWARRALSRMGASLTLEGQRNAGCQVVVSWPAQAMVDAPACCD